MNFHEFGMDSASLSGPLEARLAAVRAAGFNQIMISPEDLVSHPISVDAAILQIQESGLQICGLSSLCDFEGLSSKLHDYKIEIAKAMILLCKQVGSRLLLVKASTFSHANRTATQIAADLRKLAFLALPSEVNIAFKGGSWSHTVPDYALAGEIVARANCPNLGIVIDGFDALKTATDEASLFENLALMNPRQIFLVQLADGIQPDIETPPPKTQNPDPSNPRIPTPSILALRFFPGEGVFGDALIRLVARLHQQGFAGNYVFDVLNTEYLQLPPKDIAQRARRAADWLGESALRRRLSIPITGAIKHLVRD